MATPKLNVKELLRVESGLTKEQVQKFFSKTPENKIKKRPAKGGGEWKYVSGSYVTQVLNSLFGFDWSFYVKTTMSEALETAKTGTVVVLGRLEVRVGDKTIVKEQFGRKEIAFKKEPVKSASGLPVYEEVNGKRVIKTQPSNIPLDFGNDLKAAATDAKKKCAAELGLFADVYSQEDFFEAQVVLNPDDVVEADPEQVKKDTKEVLKEAIRVREEGEAKNGQ